MFDRLDKYSGSDHSDPFSENFRQRNQCSIVRVNIWVLITPTPIQIIFDNKSMFNRADQYLGFDNSENFFIWLKSISIGWVNARVLIIPTLFRKFWIKNHVMKIKYFNQPIQTIMAVLFWCFSKSFFSSQGRGQGLQYKVPLRIQVFFKALLVYVIVCLCRCLFNVYIHYHTLFRLYFTYFFLFNTATNSL